jgi:hypothetical protein
VAHNPRRTRTPAAPPVALADARIAAALALRRRTARDPAAVVALDARDAARMTEGWRLNTQRHRVGITADDDPWWWVGWVEVAVPRDQTTALGRRCYHGTWQVWLKLERLGRWTDPGDPYP